MEPDLLDASGVEWKHQNCEGHGHTLCTIIQLTSANGARRVEFHADPPTLSVMAETCAALFERVRGI